MADISFILFETHKMHNNFNKFSYGLINKTELNKINEIICL